MEEVKNVEESTFPTKRTPDLPPIEPLSDPKKPKLSPNTNGHDSPLPPHDNFSNPVQQQQQQQQHHLVEDSPNDKENENENEKENENDVIIDRKGKGILIEDDDDDDDDSDDGDDSDSDSSSDSGIGDGLEDDDSDFADDPLAEVDLDNILPSRTRRKTIHPGVYLATDLPPEDSDDSDDPDA